MEDQARAIAGWAENVFVKIPVTNTRGESSAPAWCAASAMTESNSTSPALLTLDQVRTVAESMAGGAAAFVSVFAGRIADTGRDPVPVMAAAVSALGAASNAELIWASPRELLNIFQADAVGCPIINGHPRHPEEAGLHREGSFGILARTVEMFYTDAVASGFTVSSPEGRSQR